MCEPEKQREGWGSGSVRAKERCSFLLVLREIFVWPWKMVSLSVRYLFISQWMKRSKHGLFVFPPKKTLIWRRHCSIGQSCCSMTSKQSIDWFLESSWARSFFHPSVRLTSQRPRLYPFDKPVKSLYFCPFVVIRAFSCPFQRHTKVALSGLFVNKQMRAGSSPLIFLFLRQPIAEFPALTAPACSSLLCSLPFSRTFSYWPVVPPTWLIIRILLSADTIKTINGNLIWKQRKRGQTMVRSL